MATKHRGPHVWHLSRQINDYYCKYCYVLKSLCGTENCEDAPRLTEMPDGYRKRGL